jgi:hypothetical protein
MFNSRYMLSEIVIVVRDGKVLTERIDHQNQTAIVALNDYRRIQIYLRERSKMSTVSSSSNP